MPPARPVPALSLAVLMATLLASPALAYTPGTGTLFSEDFDGSLDEGWETPNGNPPNPSPWTRTVDGGDFSYYADGLGPLGNSPTRHWTRHLLHPVTAGSFSIALEYKGERGTGSYFDLEVEQRAETLRKYRLRVDETGAVSLWRSVDGVMTLVVSTTANEIPKNKARWIRLAIEDDPGGHPRVRARIWSRRATEEPASWNLEFLDERDTLQRVHRFELTADGPPLVETWIDDLEAWGDAGSGVASSIQTIYLVELSHLDIGFTEPPDDIETFGYTHLNQVMTNLESAPDYRWFIESGWWLDRWWERATPAEHQRMISHLQGGRLSLAAGYANLHTTTAGQEELTRNVYWSSKLAREHGFPVRTWITDDVPGSSFAIPEILARSGFEYFIGGMNTAFGGSVNEPDHGDLPFWWVGPDGSKVLAWTTFNSYAEAFHFGFSFFDQLADLYRKLGEKLPEREEAGYDYPEMMLLRGFDNHYQSFHARNLVNQWNATYESPVFVLATPEEFFDHMLATYGPVAFPEFSGDYGCAWAPSRANAQHIQEWVREAHRKGRAAEMLLAAGGSLDRQPAPLDQMDLLYRKILEVDEHTGPGGWPGYFTPEEMERNNRLHLGYAEDARDTARSLLEQGLDRALAGLSADDDAVVAVNPLGRERDGYLRLALPGPLFGSAFRLIDRASGAEVPYQRIETSEEILFLAEAVPAMGYRVFDLVPGAPTAVPGGMLEATATTLENDFYRVEVDPADGSAISIYEKTTGRELVDTASAYRFNELASSTKQQYDYQNPPTVEPPASVTLVVEHSGPLLASLKATRSGTPHVETTYRLYRNEERLEIENVLDRDLMPYVPQTTATRAYTVTLPFDVHDFEIRTETTTRFLDPVGDGFPRGGVFDWHNVEHTLALFDEGGGIFYAVDACVAHHLENMSSLTSGSYSTGDGLVLTRMMDRVDEYEFEGGAVGPFEIEPDTSPLYRFRHHLRGTPAAFDPVEASRFGFEALEPLQGRLIAGRPGNLPDEAASFFSVDAPNVLLYTAKPADDGDGVILRMNELTGSPTTLRVSSGVFDLVDPERIEADEEGGVPLPGDATGFDVDLSPYETATVRVRTALRWSPVTLSVGKDEGSGSLRLSWSGGVSPYTLIRSLDAAFGEGVTTLLDEEPVSSHDDPVLGDGLSYFYLAE